MRTRTPPHWPRRAWWWPRLKSGKDFGELSKKYSADPGSATRGGDLGGPNKSTYVASFADALFGMQPGQISDPVKTQYGYHIIRLDEIRPAHVRTLSDAHAQIEAEYRHDQASRDLWRSRGAAAAEAGEQRRRRS